MQTSHWLRLYQPASGCCAWSPALPSRRLWPCLSSGAALSRRVSDIKTHCKRTVCGQKQNVSGLMMLHNFLAVIKCRPSPKTSCIPVA